MVRLTKKPIIQSIEAVPVVSFALPKQVVKPTSNNPAIISISQFITSTFGCEGKGMLSLLAFRFLRVFGYGKVYILEQIFICLEYLCCIEEHILNIIFIRH